MRQQRGISMIEFILVALIFGLLLAIIFKNYSVAVLKERRAIAQQSLLTVAGLQERWFVRMYHYATSIDDVGGADAAGDHYQLRVTQDPCGDTSCYTVTATAMGKQADDRECEKMSLSNLGAKRAFSWENKDTTSICWESN